MLKKVIINHKKVPVPVPIRTLREAVIWIEETLVPQGHTMTRVILNDHTLAPEEMDLATPVSEQTKLEVQIDSPVELAIQTIEAARNLSAVIFSGLKFLAVECWKTRPAIKPTDLDSVSHDLSLILDLIDHISGLVEPFGIDIAPLQGIGIMMRRVSVGITMAASSSDWKACARLLLNRLEPLLQDLTVELDSMHVRVMTFTGLAMTGNSSR